MANICCTNYILEGPRKDLESIMNAIVAVKEKPWGGSRAHAILEKLGAGTPAVDLRELVTGADWSDTGSGLRIEAESSWDPKLDVWREIRKKYPKVRVYFQAKELGCDVFFSNDPGGMRFPDRVALDWGNDKDGGVDYFQDEAAFLAWFNGQYRKGCKTIDEAQRAYGDILDDDKGEYAIIHICQDADWAYDLAFEDEGD